MHQLYVFCSNDDNEAGRGYRQNPQAPGPRNTTRSPAQVSRKEAAAD
ncbi:hypothetical protein AAur_3813 [Paenarthrobacter aurescens TC1]|uniref:Uncharacterized protein n=1 Tax=Paenarthrobacter aurescens (strain TC1) TaxID=290340 RepID=A1RB80_PAEAT|nr:hypothetical protein AAur_3813 [Paenarthrobacter aurescens TC1]